MTSLESARACDWVVVALLFIAGLLLTAQLENGYLWQDEAETALLARNVLRFGYPRASDGRNAIDLPHFGYGPGEAWIYSPWLPFYFLAGMFALAGQSTWAARLPFALAGWLSIYLTWRLARLLTDRAGVQRLSVALLTGSVPFLLHMRQCRYYALTTALLLGVCLAYLRFLTRRSLSRALGIGALMALLFHTNFGVFLPVGVSLGAHQFLRGDRVSRRHLLSAAGLVGALTLPWALAFYRSAFIGTVTLGRLYRHLEYYVRITNTYLLPLAFMGAVSCLAMLLRRGKTARRPVWSSEMADGYRFLVILVVAYAGFLLIPDQRHMRYLIPLLPVLAIGEAGWLIRWFGRRRWLCGTVAALAVGTNLLQSVHPRVPMLDVIDELTHRYEGPMEGVVRYLRAHGKPDELVKIPYDDRTVMFYTDLRVERPSDFLRETDPDWVVLRRPWIPASFFESPSFRRIEAHYERIELDAPDILWQNREDPGSHHFRTVRGAPRVVLYHKRDLGHAES